ncbi:MAG TPA: phosphoribosylglycinamide formyltransferase [Actinomycetota bacterium]|nr:phosphoribosylglycinamide formyltransferase [Actinomycetota bacterium]
MRLGILASHGGSNMQAVIDATKAGTLPAEVVVVIGNNAASGAAARAASEGIPFHHLSGRTHPDSGALDDAICRTLLDAGVDLVVLAGYMKKVGPRTIARFQRRIVNIHPALLPKFGGVGMYGMRVHEAVLESGDELTGVTIHLVDGEYDRGPVIAQTEVKVSPDDDAETLAARVLEREHEFYVETLRRIASGELDLDTLQ